MEGEKFDDEWENDDNEWSRVPDEIKTEIDVDAIVEKLSRDGYVQYHFVNSNQFTINETLHT